MRRSSYLLIVFLSLVVFAFPVYHFVSPSRTSAIQSDLSSLVSNSPNVPGAIQFAYIDVHSIKSQAPGKLHLGTLRPAGTPVADILFLHGHADRLDNHQALFRQWQSAGMRVIAFDWPSHGDSNVGPLDIYDGTDLIHLVQLVERATLEDPQRPLILAGWSYGGLVATRLMQQSDAIASLSRKPAGLLLFAPGVVVQPFVGGDGFARVETLMHAPYPVLAGPPNPVSPLFNPIFAVRTLALAWQSQHALLPVDIPVMVFVAGNTEDWYVNSPGIIQWANAQRNAGVPLQLAQCAHSRHALDNEPWPIGQSTRQLSIQFINQVLKIHNAVAIDERLLAACQPI